MRILIFTRSSWDNSNSTGNTMSNLFGNWPVEKIANFYVRSARPNNEACKYYFSITDRDVLKSIFKIGYLPGNFFEINKDEKDYDTTSEIKIEEQIYNRFRGKKSTIALFGQEFMWKIGKWNNKKLNAFLDEFKPDIIFSPSFHTRYTHKILWYMKQKTHAKIVLFHADDYLSENALKGSILEKINYKLRKKTIKKSVEYADLNYCISHKQKDEYSKLFNKEMKLLFKGADFSKKPKTIPVNTSRIRIIYIGSILHGRWKTLRMLARAIKEINNEEQRFELDIYSQYQPDDMQRRQMEVEGASRFYGKVPSSKVLETLRDSDIVLHLESFEKTERFATRLSFSTKIVDCLHSGKPIMAIGWKDAASIDYLLSNDIGLVVIEENKISDTLNYIRRNPNLLNEYAKKAWDFGKQNHEIVKIREGIISDFQQLLKD